METRIVQQNAQKLPAEGGKIVVLSVDGTSRNYDFWAIAFGTAAIPQANAQTVETFPNVHFDIEMIAEGANPVYYAWGATAPTVDDTAATAAATGNAAYVANGAYFIPLNTPVPLTITRGTHRFLAVKCAGAGTCKLRIHVKSDLDVAIKRV